jgi:hypothetical protein
MVGKTKSKEGEIRGNNNFQETRDFNEGITCVT